MTEELKQTAPDLIAGGMSQKQVCADLGISKAALQTWVKCSRLHERGMEPVRDPDHSRAQSAALKHIRELERENGSLTLSIIAFSLLQRRAIADAEVRP